MKTRSCLPFVLVAVCLSFVSCDPPQDESVSAPESVSVVNEYLNLPNPPYKYDQGPPDQIIQLGRVLFYDKNLSANNSISCGSCHKQQYAFGDNVALSKGFDGRHALRNSMPLMDARPGGLIATHKQGPMYPGGLFWDGRSSSLADAVSQPILNHIEMGMTDMWAVTNKLKQIPYYQELFATTFGKTREVQASDIQQALEFFVMAMDSKPTRFQQSERGLTQLTSSELLGKKLFTEKYNCGSCHEAQLGAEPVGPLNYSLTTIGFASIGFPEGEDTGLFRYTGWPDHKGLFKIPNLNNVTLTAPYMHDGSLATLEDVLDHYSKDIQPHPNLDARLRNDDGSAIRMDISEEEKKAVIDFLKTFTDEKMATAAEFSNPFKIQ